MKLILTVEVRQKNIAVHTTIWRKRRWQKVHYIFVRMEIILA